MGAPLTITHTFEWSIEDGKAQISLSIRSNGPVSKEEVLVAVKEWLEDLYGLKQ